MTYNRNRNAVTRVQHILDALLISQIDISFASPDPSKLAYHIWEAIKTSSIYEDTKKYTVLKNTWRIRVRSGKVLCEKKDKQIEAVQENGNGRMTDDTVINIEGAITSMVKHHAKELHFPNLHSGLLELYKWSAGRYSIIDGGEAGITMTTDIVPEFAWTPNAS